MGLDFRLPRYITGFRWGDTLIWSQSSGGGTSTTVSGTSPLTLSNALKKSITRLVQYGKVEQNETPAPASPVDIVCNNGTLVWKDRELPVGYTRIQSITFNGNTYYETNEKLYGSDIVTITIDNFVQSGQNLFGCYSGTGDDVWNFSMYVYGSATGQAYWRYGQKLYRPVVGSTSLHTLTFGADGTSGFKTNASYDEVEFETTDTARIGALPNSSSPKYDGDIIGNITVGNRLRFIPCIRQSDGKIGYYELMNQNFLEPQGSTPVAGAVDTTHMALEVVGTPEEISVGISGVATKTASAVSLFAVEQYQDTQDIITGEVVRKIGIKVFSGMESYSAMTYGYATDELSDFPNENFMPFCTHFVGKTTASAAPNTIRLYFTSGGVPRTYFFVDQTVDDFSTVDKFKAWLAAQYAAGTPVIVLYPLAETTTEQTTPQSLCTQEGTNTLSVTGAITSLDFDVTYTANS